MELKIVSNASSLIFAAKISFLDHIQNLYGKVIISQSVFNETVEKGMEKKAPNAVLIRKAIAEGWIVVSPLNQKAKGELEVLAVIPDISQGEAEAIALARQEKADWLIIDERAGTVTAKTWGVKTIGLLGIIIEAMRRGLINFDDLKSYYDKLSRTEFRLRYRDYKRAMELAEKVWEQMQESGK